MSSCVYGFMNNDSCLKLQDVKHSYTDVCNLYILNMKVTVNARTLKRHISRFDQNNRFFCFSFIVQASFSWPIRVPPNWKTNLNNVYGLFNLLELCVSSCVYIHVCFAIVVSLSRVILCANRSSKSVTSYQYGVGCVLNTKLFPGKRDIPVYNVRFRFLRETPWRGCRQSDGLCSVTSCFFSFSFLFFK